MHALNRSDAAEPACLASYTVPPHDWDNDAGPCKPAIRAALKLIQGPINPLCAYCESALYESGHVEHFRRKHREHFPELTFVWSNLFLSCDSADHCGHFKDRKQAPAFDPSDLIKPDIDNPDAFLYFHSSGQARSVATADAVAAHRAEVTIRVFGLNDPGLTARRRGAADRYSRERYPNLDDLMALPANDIAAFIADELKATASDEFCTTIRHFLQRHI